MNNARLLIVLLSLSGSFHSLFGAEPAVVKFPQGSFSYRVTIENKTSATPKPAQENLPDSPPHPEEVEITVNGNMRRYIVTWSDKIKTEVWRIPGYTLMDQRDTGSVSLMSGENPYCYIQPLDSTFFSWITPSVQTKEVTLAGRKCFFYEAETTLEAPSSFPLHNIENTSKLQRQLRQAWLTEDAFLPIAYENNWQRYKFTFGGPSPSLVLPTRFKKEIEAYEHTVIKPQPLGQVRAW